MQASPLQQVLDRFGSSDDRSAEARQAAKQALVKALQGFVKKGDLLEDDFADKGIERVSNRKLLKLHDLAERIGQEFGSRAALVDKVLELEQKVKDSGFREHVEAFGLPALYERYAAALKRSEK